MGNWDKSKTGLYKTKVQITRRFCNNYQRKAFQQNTLQKEENPLYEYNIFLHLSEFMNRFIS